MHFSLYFCFHSTSTKLVSLLLSFYGEIFFLFSLLLQPMVAIQHPPHLLLKNPAGGLWEVGSPAAPAPTPAPAHLTGGNFSPHRWQFLFWRLQGIPPPRPPAFPLWLCQAQSRSWRRRRGGRRQPCPDVSQYATTPKVDISFPERRLYLCGFRHHICLHGIPLFRFSLEQKQEQEQGQSPEPAGLHALHCGCHSTLYR